MGIVRFLSVFSLFCRRGFGLKRALMVSICRQAGKGEMQSLFCGWGNLLVLLTDWADRRQYSKEGKGRWLMIF